MEREGRLYPGSHQGKHEPGHEARKMVCVCVRGIEVEGRDHRPPVPAVGDCCRWIAATDPSDAGTLPGETQTMMADTFYAMT